MSTQVTDPNLIQAIVDSNGIDISVYPNSGTIGYYWYGGKKYLLARRNDETIAFDTTPYDSSGEVITESYDTLMTVGNIGQSVSDAANAAQNAIEPLLKYLFIGALILGGIFIVTNSRRG